MESQIWLPIATLVLGFGLSLVKDALGDKRAATAARAGERRQFERETLLDLLDALLRLGRVSAHIHTSDYIKYHEAGGRLPFGDRPPGDEEGEALLEISQRVIQLEGRLLDEGLRRAVEQCREAGAILTMRRDAEGAEKHYMTTMELFQCDRGAYCGRLTENLLRASVS